MIGFRATFNGADFPNIPDEKYTTLLYDFLKFDIGACFNQATGESGDRCKIILYADSIDGPTGVDSVNGNPAHTWFSGHVVG